MNQLLWTGELKLESDVDKMWIKISQIEWATWHYSVHSYRPISQGPNGPIHRKKEPVS